MSQQGLNIKKVVQIICNTPTNGSISPSLEGLEAKVPRILLQDIFLHTKGLVMTHSKHRSPCQNRSPCLFLLIERIIVKFGPRQIGEKIISSDGKKFSGCPYIHAGTDIDALDAVLDNHAVIPREAANTLRNVLAELHELTFTESTGKLIASLYNFTTKKYEEDVTVPAPRIVGPGGSKSAVASSAPEARPAETSQSARPRGTSPRPRGRDNWAEKVGGKRTITQDEIEELFKETSESLTEEQKIEKIRAEKAKAEETGKKLRAIIEASKRAAEQEKAVREEQEALAEFNRQNELMMKEVLRIQAAAKARTSTVAAPAGPVKIPVVKGRFPDFEDRINRR